MLARSGEHKTASKFSYDLISHVTFYLKNMLPATRVFLVTKS